MKKVIFTLMLTFLVTSFGFTQESRNATTGKIYFLRSTGFALYNAPYKVFIDDILVCKVKNNKYSIYDVQEGTYECSVQFYGKKSKEGTKKFKFTVLPGNIVYIQLSIKVGFAVADVFCEGITENTAIEKMKSLQQTTTCL
ncbi:DUF2846 domain-containing protein [Flavobacterium sp. ACAM 123]|jgi:hypothetical protein|uniref:DUF2846 domain-containing protein n=1 Tax=Flavobacterium sp. ACAM 123 TaxID=1189620 RepID=UPI000377E829|nr:DUF2846 domain-containing protein [Flavobacterium sp. ACAM 123]